MPKTLSEMLLNKFGEKQVCERGGDVSRGKRVKRIKLTELSNSGG